MDSLMISIIVSVIGDGEMKSLISGDQKRRALYVDYLKGIFSYNSNSDF